MKKQYWWTKIPYTEKKRKKSIFEFLREFVYFYRSDDFLDYEVASCINSFLINKSFVKTTTKDLLEEFSIYINKCTVNYRTMILTTIDVIEFLKTYEEDILVG